MERNLTFVGPYPKLDTSPTPLWGTHKSAKPYGAPSLVEIVTAFGEKLFVNDRAGVVAVMVDDAFALPPDPLHAIE